MSRSQTFKIFSKLNRSCLSYEWLHTLTWPIWHCLISKTKVRPINLRNEVNNILKIHVASPKTPFSIFYSKLAIFRFGRLVFKFNDDINIIKSLKQRLDKICCTKIKCSINSQLMPISLKTKCAVV